MAWIFFCAYQWTGSEVGLIRPKYAHFERGAKNAAAFTLVELLVVIGIMSTLMAIAIPSFSAVQRKAFSLRCSNHLKQIGTSVNQFAVDHRERYPESVATVGGVYEGRDWNWYDPRRLVTYRKKTPASRRSMSAYLHGYIGDADLLTCSSAPDRPSYLQEMWDAGERWDDPKVPGTTDPVTGHYAFYWNYEGLLNVDSATAPLMKFRGPRNQGSSGRYSKLLATDYFGYGSVLDDPPPNSYASSEYMYGAYSKDARGVFAYWSQLEDAKSKELPRVTSHAVFTDEHVEKFTPSQSVPMWVILDRAKLQVYEPGVHGPGKFFLPETALMHYKAK